MAKSRTFEETAYQMIKRQIDTNVWLPGFHLKEVEIADSLSMSRTPVRKAMQRLEEEGYITIESYKGAVVSEQSFAASAVIERLQFIEIMLVNLLNNMESKGMTISPEDSREIDEILLNSMAEMDNMDKYYEDEFRVFEIIFSYMPNHYIQELSLTCIKSLHGLFYEQVKVAGNFVSHDSVFLNIYQEVYSNIQEKNYGQARKRVRMIINQFILHTIQN